MRIARHGRKVRLAKCANKNVFVCAFLFAPVFSTWQRPDVNYLNCGVLRNNCLVRLGESRDNIDRARTAFLTVARWVLGVVVVVIVCLLYLCAAYEDDSELYLRLFVLLHIKCAGNILCGAVGAL